MYGRQPMNPNTIAEQTWYIDVEYQGHPQLIACGVVETEAGLLLVDPGPAVSVPTLEAKLEELGSGFSDVNGLLLTHIHLDHAGATGLIVDRHPHVQVYVHSRGARHMIHQERLLASAERLYGTEMKELWGSFLPTPEPNVHVLEGGETLEIGGRTLDVAYTPGHASHHVSYLERSTGTAFVGDNAGMRVTGGDYVLPVTPPPDVQLEDWHTSLDMLRAWEPERLFVTHFGASEDVTWHLDEISRQLDEWAERVRLSLGDGRGEDADADRARAFRDREMVAIEAKLEPALRTPYGVMGLIEPSWHGLARYWRNRD